MEVANNQGNASLPSAAPASGATDAAPMKLHFELTLPRELGGELTAWRRTFERFTDVMERWLESSLAHPGLPAPPPMPWMIPAPRAPQQPAPLPSPPPAPSFETPVLPAPRTDETRVLPTARTVETPTPLLPPMSPPGTLAPWVAETLRGSERAREETTPEPLSILPDDMPPLMIEESRPLLPPAPDAPAKPAATERTSAADSSATSDAEGSAAAEQAVLQAQQGERHRMAGRKEKALACYQEALDLDSSCAQAYLGRATIYIEQGRLHEALLDCNSALRHQPHRAVLYVLRGLVYARLDNLKRALEEAEEAIRFDPRLPSAYMLRGNVRSKKGMTDEALADVKQAIRLRPKDVKFRAELGRLLAETGQYEQAAQVYAKVLELAPDFHEAYWLRGAALRLAGNVAEAETELTEYLRRRPKAAAAHYQRGMCRLAQRNFAQAMSDFDKAIALNPNDEAARQAKQKTLDQWEGSAKQAKTERASASTVARAATATDQPASEPTRPSPVPPKPVPPKTSPAKSKPSRPSRGSWVDDDPHRWGRRAKWAGAVAAVVLMGYLFVPMVWAYVKLHSVPQDEKIPAAEVKVTADELWEQYQTNAAAAESRFGQKFIEVRGKVQDLKKSQSGPKDAVDIVLFGSWNGGRIVCTMPPPKSLNQGVRLSRVEPNGTVKLVGKCTGQANKAINLDEVRLIETRMR